MTETSYQPASQVGLERVLFFTGPCEPHDDLELAMLPESLNIRPDSLAVREWTLDEELLALLGRLLEAVFEYCFCFMCSLNNESLDKPLVGLTASSLCSSFLQIMKTKKVDNLSTVAKQKVKFMSLAK